MDLSALKIEPMGFENLLTLGLGFLFLCLTVVAAFLSRRVWLLTGSVVTLIQSVFMIVRPGLALSSTSQLLERNVVYDGTHYHLVRCFGVLLLAEAVILYRLSERDSDPTVFTSIVWARVMTSSLLTLNFVYSFLSVSSPKSKSNLYGFNDLMLYVGVGMLGVEILGGLIQLYRCPSWGGYPETFTRLNFHIRLDYFFVLFSGILTFALPHWLYALESTIEKPTTMHLYLMRAFGILCINSGLLMGRAPNFLRDNDKITLLEIRIVQNVLLMGLEVYAQNWYSVFNSFHVFYAMGGVAVWTVNAALGYWCVRGYPKFKAN